MPGILDSEAWNTLIPALAVALSKGRIATDPTSSFVCPDIVVMYIEGTPVVLWCSVLSGRPITPHSVPSRGGPVPFIIHGAGVTRAENFLYERDGPSLCSVRND